MAISFEKHAVSSRHSNENGDKIFVDSFVPVHFGKHFRKTLFSASFSVDRSKAKMATKYSFSRQIRVCTG